MNFIVKNKVITKQWICSDCKTVTELKFDVLDEDFKCMKCGKRYLLLIKKR